MRKNISTGLVTCVVLLPVIPAMAGSQNVLLIIADDLGVANIGAYTRGIAPDAGDPPPTPVIDNLSSNGILFRNAWATPVCSSTRAALYTGRHGFRNGVRRVVLPGVLPLSQDETLFAELLSDVGYTNALVGKWHLGIGDEVGGVDAPREAGFDRYAGRPTGTLPDYYMWSRTIDGVTATETGYATTVCVDDALSWIAEQTTPWTCTVAFNAPHSPFQDPPPGLHSFDLSLADDTLRYKAMIEAMDTEIGRLIAGIGSDVDNTVIIFLGDNGTPASVTEAPYTSNKGEIYDGGIRVPFIISGPTVSDGNRESLELIHATDVFATILEIAGVNAPTAIPDVAIDGVSLVPLMLDSNAVLAREFIYSEYVPGVLQASMFAVRDAQYKLVQQAGVFEFYDLIANPFEFPDLLTLGSLTTTQQLRFDAQVEELNRLRSALCSGDLNFDGLVDAADVGIFASAIDAGPLDDGDLNGDGSIDLLDYAILQTEGDQTCW
ncbi:MAG: sulfatase-like hydrolase/transferase [Planctomycetes bacterium]|nr:sulfatase-like hydrolase/transferase [Planctomycetota bacterium]